MATLSATEAATALAIRDPLDHFCREPGRTVSAVTAVTEYLDAVRKLVGRPLAEAVAGYLGTVVTVRPVDLGAAINELLASQKATNQTVEGERSHVSPNYAYMCGHFLGNCGKRHCCLGGSARVCSFRTNSAHQWFGCPFQSVRPTPRRERCAAGCGGPIMGESSLPLQNESPAGFWGSTIRARSLLFWAPRPTPKRICRMAMQLQT